MVEGNTSQTITLPNALVGVRAVICTIGAKAPAGENSPEKVDYEGVRNLVMAARNASVGRFILVSSLGVTHPEHPLNNFGRVLDWKLKGENVLRTSGLNYTIIRPGGLTDEFGRENGAAHRSGRHARRRADQPQRCGGGLSGGAGRHHHLSARLSKSSPRRDAPPKDLSDLFAALKPDRELGVHG